MAGWTEPVSRFVGGAAVLRHVLAQRERIGRAVRSLPAVGRGARSEATSHTSVAGSVRGATDGARLRAMTGTARAATASLQDRRG
jgi:hypothetical protein